MPWTVVALDDHAAGIIAGWGADHLVLRDRNALREADLIALASADAPDRLRALRLGGIGVPALILGGHEIVARAALEPVAVAEDLSVQSFEQARERVAAGVARTLLRLATGSADLMRLRFVRGEGVTALSQREADILAYLAMRTGRTVTREELQREVWGHAKATGQTRSVDMAVHRLRKKIEREPAQPTVLLTAYGGGYRLICAEPDGAGDLEALTALGRRAMTRFGLRGALPVYDELEPLIPAIRRVLKEPDAPAEVALALALWERARGSLEASVTGLDRVIGLAEDPSLRGFALLSRSAIRTELGDDPGAVADVKAALGAADEAGDDQLRCRAQIAAARHRWFHDADLEGAVALSVQAASAPAPAGRVAEAALHDLRTVLRPETLTAALGPVRLIYEELAAAGRIHDALRAGRVLTQLLRTGGETSRALDLHGALSDLEAEAPDQLIAAVLAKEAGMTAIAAGRYPIALTHLDRYAALIPTAGRSADSRRVRALLLLHLRRHDEATTEAEAASAAMGDVNFRCSCEQIRAMTSLDQGRGRHALRVLQDAADPGLAAPFEAYRVSLEGYAHHLRGDLQAAADCYERFETLADAARLGPAKAAHFTGLRLVLDLERGRPVPGLSQDMRQDLEAAPDPHAPVFLGLLDALLVAPDPKRLSAAAEDPTLPVEVRLWSRVALRVVDGES